MDRRGFLRFAGLAVGAVGSGAASGVLAGESALEELDEFLAQDLVRVNLPWGQPVWVARPRITEWRNYTFRYKPPEKRLVSRSEVG